MDSILVVITIVSVATAVTAVIGARRMQRTERQRSEARVAALATAASEQGAPEGGWTRIAGEWQWNADVQAWPSERQLAPSTPHPDAGQLFGTVEHGRSTSHGLPIIAAAVLIMMLGGAVIFLRTAAQESATVQQTSQASVPLELLVLGHTRETSSLTIAGTVRNPASGHKLEGLTAVVSLLDSNGALLSTKDVPLDYRALGPGEEAPFSVSVPDPSAIARYRVSFRAGTDVVPHVDRRTGAKLASALR